MVAGRRRIERERPDPHAPPKAWTTRLVTKYRKAWLSLKNVDIEVYGGYETATLHGDERFGADNIAIKIKIANRTMWMTLNWFTEEELHQVRDILNHAIDLALPVVRSLDELARKELDEGVEDLSPRLFRLKPSLFMREYKARVGNPDYKEKHDHPSDGTRETSGPPSD